ncbi:MAG: hypothetical protein Q8P05_03340 [Candidatus Diapherotrites archaeon]|nr:hypothetical protein [Candidatus Diapherotrites archaeon]MDZ4256069.1 hypothetical protein [archaeon]
MLIPPSSAPTRTGTNVHLLAFDTIYNPKTNETALVPAVLGWHETGWKGTYLNYLTATDINNPGTQFMAMGIAGSLINEKVTLGVRVFGTPTDTFTRLASKWGLPGNTNLYYSLVPDFGSRSQQLAVKKDFNWNGPVTSLIVANNGKHLDTTLGVEHAWGRWAAGFAHNLENQVNIGRIAYGLGDGKSHLMLFGEKGPDGHERIGIGFQIGIGARKQRRGKRRDIRLPAGKTKIRPLKVKADKKREVKPIGQGKSPYRRR